MRVRPTTPVRQKTLRRPVCFDGIGVHGNVPSRLTLYPAEADTGLVVRRVAGLSMQASWAHVISTRLATTLALPTAPRQSVSGVEHALAALRGLGVDNAIIEVDGAEAPILDGSARPFVEAIDDAGLHVQSRGQPVIEVLKSVRVDVGRAFAQLEPANKPGLSLDISIDYDDPAAGQQRRTAVLDPQTFRREIAPARTFGFTADAERLWQECLALGTSFENTVVIAAGRVLNPGGLRMADEFVRHKMLDAIGDLALAGAPLQANFRSHRGGHALTVAVLRALFADVTAWRFVGRERRREQSASQPVAARSL